MPSIAGASAPDRPRSVAAAALFALAAFAAGPSAAATQPNFGAFTTLNFASGPISGFWADGALGDFDSSQSRVTSEYTAAAIANLATGSLHASAAGFRSGCSGLGSCAGLNVNATAILRDRYVFTNSGDNIALIPVSVRVDGHCAGNGAASGRFKFGFSSGGPVDSTALPYRTITCGETVDVVAPINLLSFLGDTSFYAYVELAADALMPRDTNGFSLADFGNTLKIDVLLPEGVTARSDSGVFPFRSQTAVPEPATWAILILGFAGAGARLRAGRAARPGPSSGRRSARRLRDRPYPTIANVCSDMVCKSPQKPRSPRRNSAWPPRGFFGLRDASTRWIGRLIVTLAGSGDRGRLRGLDQGLRRLDGVEQLRRREGLVQ